MHVSLSLSHIRYQVIRSISIPRFVRCLNFYTSSTARWPELTFYKYKIGTYAARCVDTGRKYQRYRGKSPCSRIKSCKIETHAARCTDTGRKYHRYRGKSPRSRVKSALSQIKEPFHPHPHFPSLHHLLVLTCGQQLPRNLLQRTFVHQLLEIMKGAIICPPCLVRLLASCRTDPCSLCNPFSAHSGWFIPRSLVIS